MKLDLRDLTLADGLSQFGGALFVRDAIVDIENVVFSNNSTPTSPPLSGAGGAIENESGTVTIANSTFVGNSSSFAGGAIDNKAGGTLTISGSTFTGNRGLPGGAIANYGVSPSRISTVTITNSTFAGNSAVVGGAIHNLMWARVRATNTTFAANSASGQAAAIQSFGDTITVENSIFAGNGCEGFGIIDGGGNLDWPASNCPGVNADPRLGPLADNGGATQTMAIGLGGGAIDAASLRFAPAPISAASRVRRVPAVTSARSNPMPSTRRPP